MNGSELSPVVHFVELLSELTLLFEVQPDGPSSSSVSYFGSFFFPREKKKKKKEQILVQVFLFSFYVLQLNRNDFCLV